MRKQFLALSLSLATVTSSVSFADHATDNAATTARLAYRLADTAESLERYAQYDGGGRGPIHPNGNIDLTVEKKGDEIADHRGENLQQLSYVARRLHMTASDLYRAARYASGGFDPFIITPVDSEKNDTLDGRDGGHRIRTIFQRARMEYQQLRRYYANLSPYVIDQNIHYLMRDIDQAFVNLQWSVIGN